MSVRLEFIDKLFVEAYGKDVMNDENVCADYLNDFLDEENEKSV